MNKAFTTPKWALHNIVCASSGSVLLCRIAPVSR